jgi:hypothetical protein
MVVRRVLFTLMIVARELFGAGFAKDMERAGHAEMHK